MFEGKVRQGPEYHGREPAQIISEQIYFGSVGYTYRGLLWSIQKQVAVRYFPTGQTAGWANSGKVVMRHTTKNATGSIPAALFEANSGSVIYVLKPEQG